MCFSWNCLDTNPSRRLQEKGTKWTVRPLLLKPAGKRNNSQVFLRKEVSVCPKWRPCCVANFNLWKYCGGAGLNFYSLFDSFLYSAPERVACKGLGHYAMDAWKYVNTVVCCLRLGAQIVCKVLTTNGRFGIYRR